MLKAASMDLEMEQKRKELVDLQVSLTQQKISQETHEEELTIREDKLASALKAAKEEFQCQLGKQIEEAWQEKEEALNELSCQHSKELQTACEEAKAADTEKECLARIVKDLEKWLAKSSQQLTEVQELESMTKALVAKLNKTLEAKEAEMGVIKTTHTELTDKLGNLQSSHERCSGNISVLKTSLDEANKHREAAKSKITHEGQSHQSWIATLRGTVDCLSALMTKMKMAPLDLTVDLAQEQTRSLAMFFENLIVQLEGYHNARIARLDEEGQEIVEAISMKILSRLHLHNPSLKLKVIFNRLPLDDATEKPEEAVAPLVDRIVSKCSQKKDKDT